MFENIKMAIDSLRSHKLRTFLTMLGIIIGISSVITIVSLGQGGKNAITGEFEKIGTSSIQISMNKDKADSSDSITTNDLDKIKEKVASVKYVTSASEKLGTAVSNKKTRKAEIVGVSPDLIYIRNLEILYGRFLSQREYTNGSAVVVIDEDAAKSLFGYTDVVGKTIKLGPSKSPKKVTIVGVCKSIMGVFGSMDSDQIPIITYIPTSYAEQLYGKDFSIDSAVIMSTTKDNVEEAGNGAKNILESRHNARGKDIYKVDSMMKQLDQINSVLGIFTTFIGAVAAISLLVGGIGIMNILLVSVTERTREIGIRKAIGATTKTILLQFLTESVIISLIGGVIGLLFGISSAYLIGMLAGITPSLTPGVIIGVIVFSSMVGIFFGIYPAKKAAKLDPIEALRYE